MLRLELCGTGPGREKVSGAQTGSCRTTGNLAPGESPLPGLFLSGYMCPWAGPGAGLEHSCGRRQVPITIPHCPACPVPQALVTSVLARQLASGITKRSHISTQVDLALPKVVNTCEPEASEWVVGLPP